MSFHVPEYQRITDGPLASDRTYGCNGVFLIHSPAPGWDLFLICSDGTDPDALGDLADWEHVSVSARNKIRTRIPTWEEMAAVKQRCWDEEDVVVEFHPRKSEYVNQHSHVLHLWRWKRGEFPTPPPIAVGHFMEKLA